MQTFLPYPDFAESARTLDNKRLGNQCYREVKTLLGGGWKNHPASKMWRGYERSLALYGLALAQEMKRRGGFRTADRWIEYYSAWSSTLPETGHPKWLGDPDFHRSHRSNLLRKDPEHYGQFFNEPDDLPYIWPEEDQGEETRTQISHQIQEDAQD